ncbi:hypothetical protein VTH06DRAFT_3884 [Thermothelomyces fergusii]
MQSKHPACRLRRVKCDNQRPHCRKCIDGGRICAGYERETVFIIGTLDDRGRCSSHPPRVVNRGSGTASGSGGGGSSGKKTRSRSSTPATKESAGGRSSIRSSSGGGGGGGGDEGKESGTAIEVVVDGEPRPAWDDLIQLDGRRSRQRRGRYTAQFAGLGTDLAGVVVRESGDGGSCLSLPAYGAPDVQLGLGTEELRLRPRCLVHLAGPDRGEGAAQSSVCMLLYQHDNDPYLPDQPRWKDPFVRSDNVLRAVPEQFRSFPAHHFFARVYRPNAIMTALLNRAPTFLAGPQWLSVPFEVHPKAPLDRLFDNLAFLASLLARADHILAQELTLSRRLMAQELLSVCQDLEMAMGQWYASLQHQQMPESTESQPLFWPSDPAVARANQPFDPLFFKDSHTALALSYYWAALVLFYPTIWRLYFAAVVDAIVVTDTTTTTTATPTPSSYHQAHQHHHQYPQQQYHQQQQLLQGTPFMFTPLPIPPHLQDLDPMRYSLPQVRQIAGNVCRALDFLLLLLPPPLPPKATRPLAASEAAVAAAAAAAVTTSLPPRPVPGWAQPDLLWLPLLVVARFFRDLRGVVSAQSQSQPAGASQADVGMGMMSMGVGMGMEMGMGVEMGMHMGMGLGAGAGAGEGRLVEEMWCDALRERLLARVGEMREAVAARRWFDVGPF